MGKADRFGLVGHTIAGTFRVDEIVAEGGFGVVYRAYHLHFRAPVALKCLKIPDELTAEERQEFLEQFRSEAEIMFRLSASLSNIVRPLHVDAVQAPTGEFVPLMALEWLEGRSFEKIIEERCFAGLPPLPLTETLELLGPAADALDAAHHFEGLDGPLVVVHRDIKPDNLFLTNVGGKPHVKILDFGISKMRRYAVQGAGRASQTSGQAPFSPAYGAPEQWVPKRFGQTGPWTDVWGLALTLVEIIKGDAVIVGDHQAMMGTALDPLSRPTPRKEGVEVTDEIEGVFEKALALDPRFRFQTVKAFWSALRRAVELGGDPTLAQSSPSASRIQLPPMVAPTPWAPPPGARDPGTPVIRGLPPMMAPAPLEVSSGDETASVPSYPKDPGSGLAPLLPAAIPAPLDLHIPALDEETPAPVAIELELDPRFARATPPAALPELKLELDEEALADAAASSSRRQNASPDPAADLLMPTTRFHAVPVSARPSAATSISESKPPDSIELPSDFPPVELTPIHQPEAAPTVRVKSPLMAAPTGPPPRPLPEVPDLTPSRGPRARASVPAAAPPGGRPSARPASPSIPPPPPRRSIPAAPERRPQPTTAASVAARSPNRASPGAASSNAASSGRAPGAALPGSAVPGSAVPSRVVPAPVPPHRAPAQTAPSDGRPPPPPRREKAR